MKKAMENALDQNFGIHSNCNKKWCPYLRNEGDPEELKKSIYGEILSDVQRTEGSKGSLLPYLMLEKAK